MTIKIFKILKLLFGYINFALQIYVREYNSKRPGIK